jgi:catechol 2,3-dioxygenase-like lactoylglutathione lyase family enzyme
MPVCPKPRRKPAPSPLEFNHAMVYTRDLAPALHFYAGLLGFKVVEEFGAGYARLRSPRGQTSIALHLIKPGTELPDGDGIRLYFETKDLEKFCASLEGAGVALTQPPKIMPWGWKHAYLNDPDGHEVSLYWAGRKRFQKTVMAKR